MGIEWIPGPDYDMLHGYHRLAKGCLIWVPAVVGAVWLAWLMWKQV